LSPERAGRAYLNGGGIGSLAAAAFMVRYGELARKRISILEANPVMGGSLDGSANAEMGYSMRGGILTTDNDECTWGSVQVSAFTDEPGT